jgi:hypothetical protein
MVSGDTTFKEKMLNSICFKVRHKINAAFQIHLPLCPVSIDTLQRYVFECLV